MLGKKVKIKKLNSKIYKIFYEKQYTSHIEIKIFFRNIYKNIMRTNILN